MLETAECTFPQTVHIVAASEKYLDSYLDSPPVRVYWDKVGGPI